MFEILIVLTVIGVLYVEIIEILEKCAQFRSDVEQEVHRDYQVSS
jgi:hypothetical protein